MSGNNNSLVFPASIDLAGLDRNLQTAEASVSAFADTASARLSTLRAPSITLDLGSSGGSSAGLTSSVAPLLAVFAPVGGILASSIAGAIGPITGTMSAIGRVISKQLAGSARFTQIQDSFRATKEVLDHDLGTMRRSFDAFAKSADASNEELFGKMRSKIRGAEYTLRHFLLDSQASFKKGGTAPFWDTLFVAKPKTYKGGGKGGGDLGGVASSSLPRVIGGMKALSGATNVASKAAKGLGFVLTGALGPIGLLFAAGTAIHGFFAAGLKGSSDLNETITRTNIVLGQSSPAVQKFADDMATRFGMVKGTTLDTAASLSGLGRSLGQLKGDKLGAFSIQFTKLSAELAAFSNVDMSEASDAIRIGLSGNQSDLLKQRGVIIDDQTAKDYAYAHGIAKVNSELTEQQKFAARTGLILRGLGKVNGYLESTQGSAANQTRLLWGTLSNLGTSLGSVVLPVITEGIKLLNEFGGWASKAFGENMAQVDAWKNTFLNAFDWVVASVHNLPAAFEVARLMIIEKIMNIGEWFAVLGPNVTTIAAYIGRNWLLLIGDAFDATIAGLKNLWTNFQAVGAAIGEWFADPTGGFHVNWTPLLDGFKATAEQFPALLKPTLTDMSAEIAAASAPITDEVAARRAARALGPAAGKVLQNPEVDPSTKTTKGRKEKQLGAALELGSKEAYSSVAHAFSGGPEKGMDRVAKSGDETARNTKIIADHFAHMNNPPQNRHVRRVQRI